MEAAGLVARIERKSDRRSLAISLTAKGRRMFARILPLTLAETDRALSGFSSQEIATLRDGLGKDGGQSQSALKQFASRSLEWITTAPTPTALSSPAPKPFRLAGRARRRPFARALESGRRLPIPYGPKERNRFDLFLPEAAPKGLLVFLHGGYWLKFGREIVVASRGGGGRARMGLSNSRPIRLRPRRGSGR